MASMTSPFTAAARDEAIRRFGTHPRTHAVEVLPAGAPEGEWLEARRMGVGASEMAAVLGVSPHASRFSLWWQKQTGWSTDQTLAMKIGHRLEAVIADLYADERPDLMIRRPAGGLYAHPGLRWLLATPDFLAAAAGPDGTVRVEPVECKSDEGGEGWGPDGTDQVPAHHRVQVLQQCVVFGAPRGHLVRLSGKRMTSHVIELDAETRETFEGWIDAGDEFLRSITLGMPPEPDGHRATTDALLDLYADFDPAEREVIDAELVVRLRCARRFRDRAAAEYDLVLNELRAAMGRAGIAETADGVRVAKRARYKRNGYEVPPGVVDKIFPGRALLRGSED